MKEKIKLVNKVKCLLKQANAPKYLHKFGPKTYQLWQHVFALFVKSYCQLGYRDTTSFLRSLGFYVAAKSTLQRYASKLSLPFWQSMLRNTLGRVSDLGMVDATGLERTKRSWHYAKRIGDTSVKKGFKLSLLSSESKIISLRIRSKPAHDCKDVRYLFSKSDYCPSTVVMDKGYDAEWIHEFFASRNITSIIPMRKGWKRGVYRKKNAKIFSEEIYNKRNSVESIFHSLKQKFGSSISSKFVNTARSEIYCRAILHNLFCWLCLLGHNRYYNKFYKQKYNYFTYAEVA